MRATASTSSGAQREIFHETSLGGGMSLEDHWNIGTALDSISTRRWDIVVLQQGPSSLDASRANLIEWTGHFTARIRAAGGQPAQRVDGTFRPELPVMDLSCLPPVERAGRARRIAAEDVEAFIEQRMTEPKKAAA